MAMKKNEQKRIITLAIITIALLVLIMILFYSCSDNRKLERLRDAKIPDWISVQLLDQNGASTSGNKLEAIDGVVVHYVANPGTSAQANRDFFNKPDTKVNAHFVIGLDGEIIQCVPLDEESAASNSRNIDTISIEVCHPDWTGEFTEVSEASLVKLTAWLSKLAGIRNKDIIRHYDITGKLCPKFYVEHPEAWEEFKKDVKRAK